MLLTPAELRALTGRQHADAQARWLRREGWAFVLDADGRPKVAREEYDRHMLGGNVVRLPRERRPALRWDAVR